MNIAQPRAAMMLCDAAQVADGKLYILGGGWSAINLRDPEAPIFVTTAIDLAIPWDMGNRPIRLALDLVTEDFEPVEPEDQDGPIRVEGEITVGRPPQARAGVALHIPLVIPFPPLLGIAPGGYVVRFWFDGEHLESAQFQVVAVG
jgi:hypothetical protein